MFSADIWCVDQLWVVFLEPLVVAEAKGGYDLVWWFEAVVSDVVDSN